MQDFQMEDLIGVLNLVGISSGGCYVDSIIVLFFRFVAFIAISSHNAYYQKA